MHAAAQISGLVFVFLHIPQVGPLVRIPSIKLALNGVTVLGGGGL
jgi:hypothetical protein